jgi:DNA-binding MarR family transcriptional regulator
MAAPKPRTIFLLRLLQLNIYHLMVERLRAAKMTPIQYMVLSIVSGRGTWSTAALARRFHIAPQSMNEVVASLEHAKLIARRKSASHGRILDIRLTASGRRKLDRCNAVVDEIEHAAFVDFGADDLACLRDLLGRALIKFSPQEQAARPPGSRRARIPGRGGPGKSLPPPASALGQP